MLNFGLCDLRLVDPQCDHLSDAARARASGSQVPVLERAEVFPTVAAASADLRATFATTARMRDMTMPVMTPQDLARSVAELSIDAAAEEATTEAAELLGSNSGTASTGAAATNLVPMRCGLIFGPEQSGLTNADVAGCDALVQIATNPFFASLNLAQAVNLVAYECYQETLARSNKGIGEIEEAAGTSSATDEKQVEASTEAPLVSKAAATLRCRDGDRPATKGEVFGLLGRLTSALDDAEYKKGPQEGSRGNSPRSAADEKLMALTGRAALTSGEVRRPYGGRYYDYSPSSASFEKLAYSYVYQKLAACPIINRHIAYLF